MVTVTIYTSKIRKESPFIHSSLAAPSTPPPYPSYFHNKPQETHKLSIGSDMPLESSKNSSLSYIILYCKHMYSLDRVQSYFDPSDTKTGNVYSKVQDKR